MKPDQQQRTASLRSIMQRLRGTRWRIALAAAFALLGLAAGLWSAVTYDVAATEPHGPAVEWVLSEGMERSVRRHAAEVEIPPGVDLRDPALAERAIGHYSVACATCHGAPGEPRAPWMVLYPAPRELTDPAVVGRWSDRELYWIIKHGIKDTGMIALGPTHPESDLWAVSAFVRQLPEMKAGRYRTLRTRYQSTMDGAAAHPVHAHDDGR